MAKNQTTQIPRARKAKDFWGTIRRLIKYMSSRFWALFLTIIFAIAAAIFSAITPNLVGQATTVIFDGVTEGMALRDAGCRICAGLLPWGHFGGHDHRRQPW